MKRKLQVFISSTFEDMKDERQAAVEAVLRAGHIPAGMELFAAGDESQMETIRHWIDDSDIFMLILGGRYGSIDAKTGKSYIQLEYEYAAKAGKRFCAIVIEEQYLKEKVKLFGPSAIETHLGVKLEEFRNVVTKKMCRFYHSIDSLKLNVFEALTNFDRDSSLSGWVPGSEVHNSAATLDAMTRLQNENDSYRERIDELEAKLSQIGKLSLSSLLADLSAPAKRLITELAKDEGGGELYVTLNRRYLVGGKSTEFVSRRDAAVFEDTVSQLNGAGLVQLVDAELSYARYTITAKGFEFADLLAADSSGGQADGNSPE